MAKMAEGMARVADGVAAGRRRRGELASEVRAATNGRRGEVRSLLANLRGSLGRASREQAANMNNVTTARHGEIHTSLESLQASREKAIREYRSEAGATAAARKNEVSALLTQFLRERVARRRHHQALATALRDQAAASMRDLTSGVATLRDNFAKEGRDRAAAIRERLSAYALDRRDANAVWRQTLNRGRIAVSEPSQADPRPAEEAVGADLRSSATANDAPVAPNALASPSSESRTDRAVAARSSEQGASFGADNPSDDWGHDGATVNHERDSQ